MPRKLTRRDLLKGAVVALGGLGLGVGGYHLARQGYALQEQHETWVEAARPNSEFLARHDGDLQRLRLGGSFAPEEWWPMDEAAEREAQRGLDIAINRLNLRQLRLGLRWSRSVDQHGAIDLRNYAPYIDYCLRNGVEVCLNVGPIRVFRWPEEHVPAPVLERLTRLPEPNVTLEEPLAQAALAYLDRLLDVLKREYGDAFAMIQVENEPFYALGEHEWRMTQPYLEAVATRVDAVFPDAELLLTSAGRLNLNDIRDTLARLQQANPRFAGRLVSGFDFHYKTPSRDSIPVIRHFDQIAYARPFTATPEDHQRDARRLGFRIEVTEGQMEPYGYFTAPGNSAKDFRYMLLRCLDKVLDPQAPALIRIWGVEDLVMRLLANDQTAEHRQIVDLIQTINAKPFELATGNQQQATR